MFNLTYRCPKYTYFDIPSPPEKTLIDEQPVSIEIVISGLNFVFIFFNHLTRLTPSNNDCMKVLSSLMPLTLFVFWETI